MLIQRSQSAPQPIQSSSAATKVKAATSNESLAKLSRSNSYLVRPSVTSSPLATPWIEREDPFSLGGFFPASNRAVPEEEEQWKWLRKEEDDSVGDDKESSSSFSVDDSDSVIGEFEDELAETIRSEDKFGLLSLGSFTALNLLGDN
jgi:hypothetical protein